MGASRLPKKKLIRDSLSTAGNQDWIDILGSWAAYSDRKADTRLLVPA